MRKTCGAVTLLGMLFSSSSSREERRGESHGAPRPWKFDPSTLLPFVDGVHPAGKALGIGVQK